MASSFIGVASSNRRYRGLTGCNRGRMRRTGRIHCLMLALAVCVSGCESNPSPPIVGPAGRGEVVSEPVSPVPLVPPPLASTRSRTVQLPLNPTAHQASGPPEIELGTGRFVGAGATQTPPISTVVPSGQDVTLDFVNADVRDVARSVLGDLLKVSYDIDPAAQGTVTLQTGRPIPRSTVLPMLASALQSSGIALVERGGLYHIVPIANAARWTLLGGSSQPGFVTRVVTPQYVAAADIQRVLEPLLPPGSTVRADPERNLLMISGTEQDVADILQDESIFDVDFLRGMSFALLPLRNAQAKDVAGEVTNLLTTSGGGMSGLVKIVPIDRLNAVLVTSMRPNYIDRVRAWVDRLDRGGANTEQQLFVYRVQNGRATDLASVLRRALGIETSSAEAGQGTSAGGSGGVFGPERTPATPFVAASSEASGYGLSQAPRILLGGLSPGQSRPQENSQGPLGAAPGSETATSSNAAQTDIRVTADDTNNALVISATPQEYAQIAAVLQRLDILPLQVLIDATVAEVTLTKQLTFGLQYFINTGNFKAIFAPNVAASTTSSTTTVTTPTNIVSSFPGISFTPGLNAAFTSSQGSSVILQALSQFTNVRVLSSPNLVVLNNQSARLQVGQQVPIATQSAVSVLTPGAPQVNTIEYRDTGVILEITPRVNASGLVLLDMAEEVSQVTPTTSSSLNTPTISQRRVTSSIAIADGQTIGLAGLIQDNRTTTNSGIPVLKNIPLVGWLFGTRSNDVTRDELIVLITPHVIRDRQEGDAITNELREKLPLTIPLVGAKVQ